MNEEILKLAKECRIRTHKYNDDHMHTISNNLLEDFYRAAYNKAIEDAAKKCDVYVNHPYFVQVEREIRALEMK